MIKIYRPLIVIRILNYFALLFDSAIFILLFLFLGQLHVQAPWLILFAGLCLGYLLWGVFQTSQIRLEISDAGIKYFGGGYVISTSWDNVKKMGKRVPNNLLNFPVEGLILCTPSAVKPSLIAGILLSGRMGYYEVNYSRSIPLQGSWSWNWKKSELAKDIVRYLPDLFER